MIVDLHIRKTLFHTNYTGTQLLIAIIEVWSIANAYYYGVSYAHLHPVPLKGKCHFFALVKLYSLIYKIAVKIDISHLISKKSESNVKL